MAKQENKLYKVTNEGKERLVAATNSRQALYHVIQANTSVEKVEALEVATLLQGGAQIETAGAEDVEPQLALVG